MRSVPRREGLWSAVALVVLPSMLACGVAWAKDKTVIRVGYFPNITHSQALIGLANGAFQKQLGKAVEIQPVAFNAGPSVIEALFAGAIDLSYIGPNPAINGYIKSGGKALRVVAGATSGGASLVVRGDSGIRSARDLAGKRIASPQLGNTQDVALRNYIVDNGLKAKERGGTVEVTPVPNPDQLTLFMKKAIDGAWAPEPWATRLVKEAGGRILVDERKLWPDGKFATALIIVSADFLDKHRDIVKDWLEAHVQLTKEIERNPGKALKTVNAELKRLTGKALDDDVIEQAFSRLDVTYDPLSSSLRKAAESAYDAGFLGTSKPDLSKIFELGPLNEVLKGLGLKQVK